MARKQPKGMTPERRERAAKSLRLRKQGMTYAAIGAENDTSEATAYQDVKKALEEITREPAEEVRQMELERLDEMLTRLNGELAQLGRLRKLAESKRDPLPFDKTINSVTKIIDSQLRIQERRAKLLGLETAKAEVSMDVTQAIHDALGTVTAVPEEELMGQIGEGV